MFNFLKDVTVPKENLIKLIDEMDQDSDGFVSLGEVKDLVKKYKKAVFRSARFARR